MSGNTVDAHRAQLYAAEAMRLLATHKAEIASCVSNGTMSPDNGIRRYEELTALSIATAFTIGHSVGYDACLEQPPQMRRRR
jgi:hypothetical protein